MGVETQVLPLDALAGKLAPYSDHVTCDLLSLSKIKWLLYSIHFLPCGGLFKFFPMHSMAVGLLGLCEISHNSVLQRGDQGDSGIRSCASFSCWLNFYRLSQLPL